MNQVVLAFKVVTLVFAALASIMNPPANVVSADAPTKLIASPLSVLSSSSSDCPS